MSAQDAVIARRKEEHLDIVLTGEVQARARLSGFETLHFAHEAMPELALESVQTTTSLFGQALAAPFVIGAMTGGTERAARINEILAEAASVCGVGLCLGLFMRHLLNRQRGPDGIREH